MSIKQWPVSERPREKLLSCGPASLSDAELLAIFLRTGCAGKSAVDLARSLLQDFKGLRPLLEADEMRFCQSLGLGKAKYAQLQATLEMGRRHLAESLGERVSFDDSTQVKHFLISHLRHRQREVFAVLYLNSQHALLAYEEVFEGTINSAPIYPREIAKLALKHNAAAVVLSHNHPSGLTTPSRADRQVTKDIVAALTLLDIKVLDHIIVGDGEPSSFVELGLL